MKKEKILSAILSSAIIALNPTPVFAWIQKYEYNTVNIRVSGILRAVAVTAIIIYIIIGLTYVLTTKDEKEKAIKNITKWLVITGVVVMILLYVASWVYQAGLMTY